MNVERGTRFTCDQCGDTSLPGKRLVLDALPAILVVHLLRYQFDVAKKQATKLTHPIDFQKVWHLKGTKYNLKAVIYHRGDNTASGHYWCCGLADNSSCKQWWTYNDAESRKAVAGEPVTSKDKHGVGHPYLLFYEKACTESAQDVDIPSDDASSCVEDPSSVHSDKLDSTTPPPPPPHEAARPRNQKGIKRYSQAHHDDQRKVDACGDSPGESSPKKNKNEVGENPTKK